MTLEKDKLDRELDQFQNIWHGGYFTGYSPKRNQKGLEEYLRNNLDGTTLLEIGCGGGQWTKFIYELNIFKKIICIDALSAEHNKFWENLGDEAKKTIQYIKVENFDLTEIDENSIDYVFSYDVFCHISYSGTESYLKNLYSKCKKKCKLLIMYADPEKYLISEPENRYHVIRYLPKNKFIYKFSNKILINDALEDADANPIEPRWFWVGKRAFVNLCKKYDYSIIDKDINIDKTNPITLFQK
tara:strand:+ start:255 stop:983 length:729 start_codon:yes stop_codon:yes gene_type:complete